MRSIFQPVGERGRSVWSCLRNLKSPLNLGPVAKFLLVGSLIVTERTALAFAYFPTPTKWAPNGPGQYQEFQAIPPNGPHSRGVATYSYMKSGLQVWDLVRDPKHGLSTSYPLASLVAPFNDDAIEKAVIFAALAFWEKAADTQLGQDNLAFQYVDQDAGGKAGDPNFGTPADIRIGVYQFTEPVVGSHPDIDLLAHAFQPGTLAFGGTIFGDIHFRCRLNNDEASSLYCPNGVNWVFDANPPANTFDLLTVAVHEVGHALGLFHDNKVNSVMQPIYAGVRRQLGQDDIFGVQALYAPIPEPSGTLLVSFAMLLLLLTRNVGLQSSRPCERNAP